MDVPSPMNGKILTLTPDADQQADRSVAEIGALLHLPIGVVRVLLDDMAGLGLVTVHNETTADERPDVALMQHVLHGLTNLRS